VDAFLQSSNFLFKIFDMAAWLLSMSNSIDYDARQTRVLASCTFGQFAITLSIVSDMSFSTNLELIRRNTLFFLVRHLSHAICTRCRPGRCFRLRPTAGGEADEADAFSDISKIEVDKLVVGLQAIEIGCIRPRPPRQGVAFSCRGISMAKLALHFFTSQLVSGIMGFF
jgi:hypothetical protein